MSKLKLALMDMNNGRPNQGMRGLREIVNRYQEYLTIEEFEVRQQHQIPDLGYDIYISSGGPGDPRDGHHQWEKPWHQLVRDIWEHNLHQATKKYVFFVCHSFQMACHQFGLCEITKRKSTSFGIYPIHKTPAGKHDILLEPLDDPFYAVDSRDWQLVEPNKSAFEGMGAQIISREKIRTHIELERAIMAIRFSPEMVGTQFHPEADPRGMKKHFSIEENREKVIKNYDLKKYQSMMSHLEDPEKISRTHDVVIPGFLERAIHSLSSLETIS